MLEGLKNKGIDNFVCNQYKQINMRATKQTVVTGLSIEPDLLALAKARAKACGFKFSFSAYVADVLRRDIQCLATQSPSGSVTSSRS